MRKFLSKENAKEVQTKTYSKYAGKKEKKGSPRKEFTERGRTFHKEHQPREYFKF